MRAAALVLLTLSIAFPAFAASAPARTTIELRADKVIIRSGGAVLEARGNVRITDGRNRMTAGHAVYAVRERRIVLSGGVTVTTKDGDLEAASATVFLGAGRTVESIEAAGKVVLEAQQRVIRAERLTYSGASGAVTGSGGVEVFVPPDLIASGSRLVMKGREAATLEGRARVQTKDGYIEGDRIDYSDAQQTAYVRGNVTSEFEETRITAAAATFYGRERKAVFRDGVRIIRPGRRMQADVVTVFYQDRRIVAEGQTTIRLDEEQKP